jgi:hypothetical protein
MTRCSRAAAFAALSILWCGVSASAETLRCQSVNGNLNCAGSEGVSCQTINGKKVCVSGHGGVVQSFGNAQSPDSSDDEAGAEGLDDPAPGRAMPAPGPDAKEKSTRHDPDRHTLLLERDGSRLHLRTDRLSIDRY